MKDIGLFTTTLTVCTLVAFVSTNLRSQSEPPVSVSKMTDERLEGAQREVIELKERNRSLEKECVIYQSQLKVRTLVS